MIKSIGDNYKIYGLIIVETAKKSLVLDYELSNATFETPNHAFTLCQTFEKLFVIYLKLNKTKMSNFEPQTSKVLNCRPPVIVT
jgi:hypothetical protein